MIYLFFSWAALGSKPGCPGSTRHSCQVSGRSRKATGSISAISPREDLTKLCGDAGMLVAAAQAGLVQGPDPGGQDAPLSLGDRPSSLPWDSSHRMHFFSRAGPSCAEKLTVLKVNILSG